MKSIRLSTCNATWDDETNTLSFQLALYGAGLGDPCVYVRLSSEESLIGEVDEFFDWIKSRYESENTK